MPEIKGLSELYIMYRKAVAQNQSYLDPQNDPDKKPNDMGTFIYTLNSNKFMVAGDTTRVAMERFCEFYEEKSAKNGKVCDLYDPDVLACVDGSLRLPGVTEAKGLYFHKR
ncbi:hypothetical protein A9Q84_14600 [Halobacteriovorax marinus]|uniref:Uncharacterized protein n=1 Tax=Halobacteriovorax marinus TaxID=97084 RepID=A0A1Y5F594_9BACT|nr:hypothetical protein A9Q84_14600 [Halobacteriovorax marinus]